MKVGLIGGSFNPVHLGHLRGAEEIKEILGLDQIIFIPALIPPHKNSPDIADKSDRLEMLNIATQSNSSFIVSDIELKREGPSYTIDTLKQFNTTYSDHEHFFILGTELFTRIDSWKDYKNLFNYANFIILNRPGYYEVELNNLFPLEIKKDFKHSKKDMQFDIFDHISNNKLIFININGIKLSSTKIRSLIRDNKSIKYLVPQKIEEYIIKNGLYLEEGK